VSEKVYFKLSNDHPSGAARQGGWVFVYVPITRFWLARLEGNIYTAHGPRRPPPPPLYPLSYTHSLPPVEPIRPGFALPLTPVYHGFTTALLNYLYRADTVTCLPCCGLAGCVKLPCGCSVIDMTIWLILIAFGCCSGCEST
jgi:hypothetical protein